jgi:hypothetical protein
MDRGITLEKVATLLGHEILDITMLYATPDENNLEQAARVLVE